VSRAPSEGDTVTDLLRRGYSLERAEKESTHVLTTRPQYKALMAAAKALVNISADALRTEHWKAVDEALAALRAAGIDMEEKT